MAATPEAMDFFPGHYGRLSDVRAKVAEIDGRFDEERCRVALSALRISEQLDEARRESWIAEGGLMVTTGQQPGLFGGPLYSVYKALGALRLAQELETTLGRPVIPVFWVADEDHDWEEADHTYLLDRENVAHRITVPDPGAADRMLHRVPLNAGISEVLEQFTQLLPQSDFSEGYIEQLRRCFQEEKTLSEGFLELMEGLLAPLGMCFTHASQPELKAASADLLFQELESSEASEALLAERATALETAGFGTQVTVMEGGVNLFLEGEGGRERIYRTDEGFRLAHSNEELSTETIRARVEADPQTISPNVLLRPVVESHVFPTVSYVAGPGELAYFAQISDLFEAHGILMPLISPRPSFTVVEGKVAKVLGKFGMEVEHLGKPFHEVASEIARDEVPDDVRKALGQLRGAIGEGVGKLLDAAKTVDPTLKGPVSHLRGQAFKEIAEVEKKIVQSVKRENEIGLAQLEKAQHNLFPEGKPQERVLNPHYYLARYGNSFLEALVERIEVEFK
jgi:bacillithiol synthase